MNEARLALRVVMGSLLLLLLAACNLITPQSSSAPLLVIESPSLQSTTSAPVATITGRALHPTGVTRLAYAVNDGRDVTVPITRGSDVAFEIDVPLAQGQVNTIVITASAGGARVRESITITHRLPGISGRVTNARAGEPVSESTILVTTVGGQEVATIATDESGSFYLPLEPGHYDLVLSKPGFAASAVRNARVTAANVTTVDVVQMRAFNPARPAVAPAVTLHGVEDGKAYDGSLGYITYRVTSEPADASLYTNYIYAALDKTPGSGFITGTRDFFAQTSDTGLHQLDPYAYAAQGDTTFEVVVYDSNNNRTHLLRHIHVNHSFLPKPGLDPLQSAPHLASVLAVTTGKQLEFLTVSPQAAPAGSNLFVQLAWFATGAYGYHVERSFDGVAFERIGSTADSAFVDASPELEVGRTVHYRVRGYVGSSVSEPSAVLTTTPLPEWDVRLTSPEDDAQNVGTVPTFEWSASRRVSANHYYVPALFDTITGDWAMLTGSSELALVNRTSWTWNEDGSAGAVPWFEELQRGRTYEWLMYSAYATDDALNPTAVSVAVDLLGLWTPGFVHATDNFTFTTAP